MTDSPSIDVAAAAKEILGNLPSIAMPIEPLRDGRIIDGYACRMTIGRLALIEASGCKLFCGTESDTVSEFDVFLAFWMTIEDHIDEAVRVCEDGERLKKEIESFIGQYSKKKATAVCASFYEWLSDIAKCMPQRCVDDGASGQSRRREWWPGLVDILASEYHWGEGYILWQLPLVRAIKYQEHIYSRQSGQAPADDIGDDIAYALDSIKEVVESGKS